MLPKPKRLKPPSSQTAAWYLWKPLPTLRPRCPTCKALATCARRVDWSTWWTTPSPHPGCFCPKPWGPAWSSIPSPKPLPATVRPWAARSPTPGFLTGKTTLTFLPITARATPRPGACSRSAKRACATWAAPCRANTRTRSALALKPWRCAVRKPVNRLWSWRVFWKVTKPCQGCFTPCWNRTPNTLLPNSISARARGCWHLKWARKRRHWSSSTV